MEAADTALLVLRVWIAIVMLAHGIRHARTLEGTAGWFESLGFRQAGIQARASAAGEIAIGLGIGFGLLTAVAAAGLVATTFVAFWSVHRKAGFFVFARPDEGYEYVVTLSLAALMLAVFGPGEASLDQVLDITITGWTGGLVGLAGVVGGAIHLALFWREPEPAQE